MALAFAGGGFRVPGAASTHGPAVFAGQLKLVLLRASRASRHGVPLHCGAGRPPRRGRAKQSPRKPPPWRSSAPKPHAQDTARHQKRLRGGGLYRNFRV